MARRHLVSKVREGPFGKDVTTVRNPLLLPLALIEVLVIVSLGGLNYCLRFDPSLRPSVSMVHWEGVSIPCFALMDGSLSRPLYDYGNLSDPTLGQKEASSVAFDLPEWVFFTCFFSVPILLICVGEAIFSQMFSRRVKVVVAVGSVKMSPWLRRTARFICGFLLGGCLVGSLVAVLKLMVPAPRPHFLAACTDELSKSLSMCDTSEGSLGLFYPAKACYKDPKLYHEALRSFPSYHATLAFYGGVFSALYLTRVLHVHGVYSCSGVLSTAVLVMAFIGASHRMLTGHAFLLDVVVGGVIGTLAAFCVVRCLLNKFKEHRWRIHKLVSKDDANLLPILPLNNDSKDQQVGTGSTHFYYDNAAMESDSSESDNEFSYLSNHLDTFAYIPRAHPYSVIQPLTLNPAQAVNKGVSRNPSNAQGQPPRGGTTRSTGSSIPPAPPLPSNRGPPPGYAHPKVSAWSTAQETQSYNVPRQRMSAPSAAEPRQHPPDYQPRPLSFYRQDSQTLPRTRTETSSYF